MSIIEQIEQVAADFLHRTHAADAPPPIEFDDGGWAHGENVTAFRKMPGIVSPTLDETLKQQSLAKGLDHIEGIVWHYTDTRGCGADALAKRLLDPTNKRAASWHICIDATGHISQSVSAKCGSWHAGGEDAALFRRDATAGWIPLTAAERGKVSGYSANSWAFGIELENAGEVRLVDGKWCSWPFKFGTQYGAPIVVPEDEVAIASPGHGWHRFTSAQIDAARRVLASLAARYGLRRDACGWTHKAIDPQNRTDPGPLWEGDVLPGLLGAVFGAG